MADQYSDGNVKVGWVTTLASITVPETSEVTAGVDLESFITPDGLQISLGDDSVDTSALNSTFSTSKAGRATVEIELTFKQQGVGNAPWTTFASRPSGWLVVRRNVATTTDWANGQLVEVYPCKAGDRKLAPPAANELEKFMVQFFPTSDPQLHATLTTA